MKKTVLLILLLFFITLSSCSKKALIFSEDNVFSVKEILNAKNCDVSCNQIATCEGKVVLVKGVIDQYNINASEKQFFLIEGKRKSIQVIVSDSAVRQVFKLLHKTPGAIFRVRGVINGFDAPTNMTCDRLFTIQLNSAKDLVKLLDTE